ncbi:zinc finger MYND domain-containing protein [Phanerochaete sordida]|uniref:Zinc finger MYND domain-containing protein n=1 Tax=Phanerochaete sordida TaxID=48140 RepID=A0A9P3LI52_9APHY|nr:zinc finger MYND domain-containing protein [Phanerochaete sordida]
MHNPYLLRLLMSERVAGLPDLVADLDPFCALLAHFLFYCDMDMRNDRKSCFDVSLRYALTTDLPQMQRLAEGLETIEETPENSYLGFTQEYKFGLVSYLTGCDECGSGAAEMLCSQCKTVKYCGTECQTKAWKGKHKRKCWRMVEEAGNASL